MKWILTDIEGTTTKISFVKDVLFPYAFDKMEDFLKDNIDRKEVSSVVEEVQKEHHLATLGEVTSLLKKWILEDKKEKSLKALQGLIWEEGYKNGEITAHVYEDVPVALKMWSEKGLKLAVYSSGSIKAQLLLFKYTSQGDLNPFFSNNFDLSTGFKYEKGSYEIISDKLGCKPSEVLFLSDMKNELEAATKAGMKAVQLCRENQIPDFMPFVHQFSEIDLALFQ